MSALDSIEGGRWAQRPIWSMASTAAEPGRSRAIPWNPTNELLAQIAGTGANSSPADRFPRRSDPASRARRGAAGGRGSGRTDQGPPSPASMVYAVPSHAPRPIAVLRRGEVEQPGEPVGPGTLSCLPGLGSHLPRPISAGTRAPAARRWPTGSPAGERADLAVDRQPPLALPLRPRAGRHAQRLRPQRLAADAPRTARLAGGRAPRQGRPVAQGAAPADRLQRRVSPGVARRRRLGAGSTPTTASSGG